MPNYAKRALRYAERVRDGKVRAPKFVRAACLRHLRDLEGSQNKKYPYEFVERAGNRICEFAERMVHIKGKWALAVAGELPLIVLEDWECFVLAVPFGWLRREDGLRRFREIYAEIPRKNAKSTLGAIIGLYMAFADSEPGAEVFAGATSEDQAYAVFKPAWLMVQKNPEFRIHFGLDLGGTEKHPGVISQLATGSSFKTIIGNPGDGDSPSCAIVDEYHEHRTSVQYDTMKTGMGSRAQPMRVVITTAGVDTSGPCFEKHLDAIKILEQTLEDDETFTIIYAADEEADWRDFEVWKMVNPNFGVSVFPDYLRGQLKSALEKVSEQNINRTKHLNQWMSAGSAWMNMAKWAECKDETLSLEQFRGCRCWLGADLASKIDIAALAYIIEAPWGWVFFCKHYLPEETVNLPPNQHYRKWRDQHWLTVTPGARTDLKAIEADIKEASLMLSVQSLAYDQKESNYLITNIEEWASFDCVDVPQGPAHMSEPMKEMEATIYAKTLRHSGDPVLTWQMGNVVKKQGRSGGPVKYYYPTRQNDKSKIDGPVSGIMALSRAMTVQKKPQFQTMLL